MVGSSSVKLPCIIWAAKALYRLVPVDFNGQDRDMDVNFATDFICCICECAVSEGVDMFPQTGTKSDINQTVSCHVETVCLLSKKH